MPQGPVLAVLHHREVARKVQRDLVAVLAVGLGCGTRRGHHVVGHAGEFVCAGVSGKTVGSVEHVFGERLGRLGLRLLQLGEALFRLARELGAGEHKVSQCVVQGLGSGRRQRGGTAPCFDGLVLGEQPLIGAHAGVEVRDLVQVVAVGRPQFRRVRHRVKVPHGAPGSAQPFGGHVQHRRQGVIVGGK